MNYILYFFINHSILIILGTLFTAVIGYIAILLFKKNNKYYQQWFDSYKYNIKLAEKYYRNSYQLKKEEALLDFYTSSSNISSSITIENLYNKYFNEHFTTWNKFKELFDNYTLENANILVENQNKSSELTNADIFKI